MNNNDIAGVRGVVNAKYGPKQRPNTPSTTITTPSASPLKKKPINSLITPSKGKLNNNNNNNIDIGKKKKNNNYVESANNKRHNPPPPLVDTASQSSVVVSDANTTLRTVHWIYVHYHKTGHDLSEDFGAKTFNNLSHCHFVNHATTSLGTHDAITETNLVTFKRGHYTWEQLFFAPNHYFKIVHFAREPYDMVMSGYLYHSQIPIPAPEQWLESTGYDPCDVDVEGAKKYFVTALLTFVNHDIDVDKMVNGVYALCHQLKRKYHKSTFSQALYDINHGPDIFDAIRYEACRAIQDIVHMGANAFMENEIARRGENSHMASRRVYTSDFPVVNQTTFFRNTDKLFNDFLLKDSPLVQFDDAFYHCATNEAIVAQAKLSAYKSLPKVFSSGNESKIVDFSSNNGTRKKSDSREHVTSNLMPSAMRLGYIARLQHDQVLAPVLDIVHAIMFDGVFDSIAMKRKWDTNGISIS